MLDQSNEYIKEVQEHLEQKDWRGVLADAQNKCEIEWPEEEEEESEEFQKMWAEVGGNKIKTERREVEGKKVAVEVGGERERERERAVA